MCKSYDKTQVTDNVDHLKFTNSPYSAKVSAAIFRSSAMTDDVCTKKMSKKEDATEICQNSLLLTRRLDAISWFSSITHIFFSKGKGEVGPWFPLAHI